MVRTGDAEAREIRAPDGAWIRHGTFARFHADGRPQSQGLYDNGTRTGRWSEWHPNGQLAARG